MGIWLIAALACLCGAFVIAFLYVSSQDALSPLEAVLFQIVILATGVGASYLFSQRSARAEAEQLVKPHARSAFRRVMSLYSGLFYLKTVIDERPNSEDAGRVVEIIEAVVDSVSKGERQTLDDDQ